MELFSIKIRCTFQLVSTPLDGVAGQVEQSGYLRSCHPNFPPWVALHADIPVFVSLYDSSHGGMALYGLANELFH